MIKSLHLLLGRPGDHLPTGILSFDILTNLPASILVTFWSHVIVVIIYILFSPSAQPSYFINQPNIWLVGILIYVNTLIKSLLQSVSIGYLQLIVQWVAKLLGTHISQNKYYDFNSNPI